jgi:hypothetical protein
VNNCQLNLNEATNQYDDAFDQIQGLKWRPWVGQRFSARLRHQRLLVVGESHYFAGDTPEKRQADRDGYEDRQFTKIMVTENGYNTKTWNNIPLLLFKISEIDRSKFWGDCAYYNFVQRPMDKDGQPDGKPERPTENDFVTGWRVFAEVVNTIQPSHCLFIGVSTSDYFNSSMAILNLSSENITWPQKVGRTWARTAKLKLAGTTTELIFIQHLGKYFSWLKWHDYLQIQHKDFMSWLGVESYFIKQGS